MLAESPQPFSGEVMASRIYSPFAYPLVRRAHIVPIVAGEAGRLAPHFPVVWRRGAQGPELVVLRTLLDDGTGLPPGFDRAFAHLPLLLQAYPFTLAPEGPHERSRGRRLLDTACADEPGDAGAPIAGVDGRLTRGAELRLRALELFERDFERTLLVGRALDAAGLLEPWPLVFDLGHGYGCEITELLVVRAAAFDTPALAPVVEACGVSAAQLLGLHALSLFRAGPLLALARGACARRLAA